MEGGDRRDRERALAEASRFPIRRLSLCVNCGAFTRDGSDLCMACRRRHGRQEDDPGVAAYGP